MHLAEEVCRPLRGKVHEQSLGDEDRREARVELVAVA